MEINKTKCNEIKLKGEARRAHSPWRYLSIELLSAENCDFEIQHFVIIETIETKARVGDIR